MKNLFYKRNSFLFYITLYLTLICWFFLFVQLISSHFLTSSHKAIPAFQSIAATSFETPPDQNTIYKLLKEYDSDIRLISCHKEHNYTDLYFYSPAIHNEKLWKNTREFNLQVAITKTHVYFGNPIIQYDF